MRLKKSTLVYALVLALGAFLVNWLEMQYSVRLFSTELYIVLLALLFTGLGIWLGSHIRGTVDPPVFERNERVIQTLGLTGKELEVLELLAGGGSNQEIADQLFVSNSTIKTHLVHLYQKLEVSRRTQAVQKSPVVEDHSLRLFHGLSGSAQWPKSANSTFRLMTFHPDSPTILFVLSPKAHGAGAMKRLIFSYGTISGFIIIVTLTLSIELGHGHVWLGYLIMFIAFSMIYVAVKRYRDETLGGVISFVHRFADGAWNLCHCEHRLCRHMGAVPGVDRLPVYRQLCQFPYGGGQARWCGRGGNCPATG